MVAEGGEGENPLPFSLTAPKRRVGVGGGGGGGGGGRGGIPASFPSRSPPPKQPFQPTPTPSPGSDQEVCEKSLTTFFLLRLKPMGAGLKTLGYYHNPQSADLGGRWMVSEGYSPMRGGSRLRSSISGQAFGDLANKPLSPASRQPSRVKNSKNAPVLIGS